MSSSKTIAKAVQDAQKFREKYLGQLQQQRTALQQRQDLLHAIQEARYFSFRKSRKDFSDREYIKQFAKEWGQVILKVAHLIRSNYPKFKIRKVKLPEGPVFVIAKELFAPAFEREMNPEEFFLDIEQAYWQLKLPKELEEENLPPETTLEALRLFFDHLEKHVLKELDGTANGIVESENLTAAQAISKFRVNRHSVRMSHRALTALFMTADNFLTASDFRTKKITVARDDEEAVRGIYHSIRRDFRGIGPYLYLRKGVPQKRIEAALQFLSEPKSRRKRH